MPLSTSLKLLIQMGYTKPRFGSAPAEVLQIGQSNLCAHSYFLRPWHNLQWLSHLVYFVSSTSITWKGNNWPMTSSVPFVSFLITCFHSTYLHVQSLHNWLLAHKSQDPSPQFRLVMHIWCFLTAIKCQGQVHGIDSVIHHHWEGNLVIHCPCCLELHINMKPGWKRTPSNLWYDFFLNHRCCTHSWDASKHLNQIQYCKGNWKSGLARTSRRS